MSRPGWAPDCTCGKTPLGCFCLDCKAWAGASYGDQASWSRPRAEKVSDGDTAGADQEPQGSGAEIPPSEIVAAIPTGVACKNGRHAKRPPRQGEKLLPCGCPLLAAPADCINEVASIQVSVRPGVQH